MRHKDNYLLSIEKREEFYALQRKYKLRKKDKRKTKSVEILNFEKPEKILTKEYFKKEMQRLKNLDKQKSISHNFA